MNNAMVERIRRGQVQNSVREMGLKLEAVAKELDRVVAESRVSVAGKKKPAGVTGGEANSAGDEHVQRH